VYVRPRLEMFEDASSESAKKPAIDPKLEKELKKLIAGAGSLGKNAEHFQNAVGAGAVEPSDGMSGTFQPLEGPSADQINPANLPRDCFPKDQLSPKDLLPADMDTKWSQSVPANQGLLGDQNFLTAGYHVGINTVGQSLRNANRQLRSEPVVSKQAVSPWLQSTIEPDINRKPFEIGGC
jgi:hypothetical protein